VVPKLEMLLMSGLAKRFWDIAVAPRSTKLPAKLTPEVKALPAARVGFLAANHAARTH
jgi:hypothetical protein